LSSSSAVAIRSRHPALGVAPARTRRASFEQTTEQYDRCDRTSSFPHGQSRRSRRSSAHCGHRRGGRPRPGYTIRRPQGQTWLHLAQWSEKSEIFVPHSQRLLRGIGMAALREREKQYDRSALQVGTFARFADRPRRRREGGSRRPQVGVSSV
jgi:hypothetical protein